MAQIVYSGDQADRGQQQVLYTADGNSYTSVESAEHTLVYIHPADGTQVSWDVSGVSMSSVSRAACPDRCLVFTTDQTQSALCKLGPCFHEILGHLYNSFQK